MSSLRGAALNPNEAPRVIAMMSRPGGTRNAVKGPMCGRLPSRPSHDRAIRTTQTALAGGVQAGGVPLRQHSALGSRRSVFPGRPLATIQRVSFVCTYTAFSMARPRPDLRPENTHAARNVLRLPLTPISRGNLVPLLRFVAPSLLLAQDSHATLPTDEEVIHKERCMNIYAGNLSFDESESSLESAFAAHCEVTSARSHYGTRNGPVTWIWVRGDERPGAGPGRHRRAERHHPERPRADGERGPTARGPGRFSRGLWRRRRSLSTSSTSSRPGHFSPLRSGHLKRRPGAYLRTQVRRGPKIASALSFSPVTSADSEVSRR